MSERSFLHWREIPEPARRRMAADFRAAVEVHKDAPEGIEHFRWWWVQEDYLARRFGVPIPLDLEPMGILAADALPSPVYREPPQIEIKAALGLRHEIGAEAAAGWDRKERVAVLFFAGGGRAPERGPGNTAVSDEGIRAIANEGAATRNREAWIRLRQLVDELGFTEGEEWKRATDNHGRGE